MYLTMVAKFSDFLSIRERTLQEILDQFVRVVLAPLEVRSALYVQTNEANEYQIVDHSGISAAAQAEIGLRYSLRDNTPTADVIRHGEIICLPNSLETFKQYPILENYPEFVGNKTLIVVPVFSDGVPVAAIGLFSKLELEIISHFESFLTALSSVFSLYYYKIIHASPIESSDMKFTHPKISLGESF